MWSPFTFADFLPCMQWKPIGMEYLKELVPKEDLHLVQSISGEHGTPESRECWERYKMETPIENHRFANVYFKPRVFSGLLCKAALYRFYSDAGEWKRYNNPITVASLSINGLCTSLKSKEFVHVEVPIEDFTLATLLAHSSDILKQFRKKENKNTPENLVLKGIDIDRWPEDPTRYSLYYSRGGMSSSYMISVRYVGNDNYEYVSYDEIVP